MSLQGNITLLVCQSHPYPHGFAALDRVSYIEVKYVCMLNTYITDVFAR
jgi:hypothetical protein